MKGMNGMVELKEKVVHSNTYGIDIRQYLTYAQIQQIVNAITKISKENDNWAERQTNIDMLVLFHATNINKEMLEQIGHDVLLTSGLIDEVNSTIVNLNQVYEAIGFTESFSRVGIKFLAQLPQVMNSEAVKAVMNKNVKSNKK